MNKGTKYLDKRTGLLTTVDISSSIAYEAVDRCESDVRGKAMKAFCKTMQSNGFCVDTTGGECRGKCEMYQFFIKNLK